MNKNIYPQFSRNNIKILNGTWDFKFDKNNIGDSEGYRFGFEKDYKINVPFSYTCVESGINIQEQIDIVWYQRKIKLTKEDLSKDVYLNFEGVDDLCWVYLNGHLVGNHQGGNTQFKVLLNNEAKEGENLLVIKVKDDFSISKARGKQRWQKNNFGCWYVQINGIYKPVFLEFLNHTHVDYFKITTNMNESNLYFDYVIDNFTSDLSLELIVSYKEQVIRKISQNLSFDSGRIVVDLNSELLDYQVQFWAPHDPQLYDLEINLKKNSETIDNVKSYFGVKEYRASGSNMLLNGFSFISKMVLYQGYSKRGLLTPKDDEEMINDIKNIKSLGFNGIRCHQYIPTERFLYLCDLLGISVWIEYPSQHLFNVKAQDIIYKEWREILKAKYNHPCVFAYVIYNESWGIRGIATNKEEQSFVEGLYQLTKSFDSVRPVISNDGWEHVMSDILTLHNYCQNPDTLERMFKGDEHLMHHRDSFASGYDNSDIPVFLSEYGGPSIGKLDKNSTDWGYGEGTSGLDEFYALFESFQKMIKNVGFKGYCYTQYRDVQQEKNGLADEDGKLKVEAQRIKHIIDNIY